MEESPKKHELVMLINRGHPANQLFEEATIAELAAPVWLGTIVEARAYLAEHRPVAGILQFPFEGVEWEDVIDLIQSYAGTTRLAVLAEDLEVSKAVAAVKAGAVDVLLPDQWHTLAEQLPRWLDQSEKMPTEAMYAAFVEGSQELTFLKDEQLRYLFVTDSYARLLGKPVHAIVGQSDFALIPPKEAAMYCASDREALNSQRMIAMKEHWGRDLYEVRKFPVCLSDGTTGVGGFVRNLSTFDTITEEANLSLQRLESLVEILDQKTDTIQELLDHSLNELIELTGSKFGYIFFYNEEAQQFILNTWSKGVTQECTVAEQQQVYDLAKTGIWGEAVRQRKIIIVNDFRADNPFKKGYPEGHVALHSFMTVPLFDGDQIVAVVGLANKAGKYTRADELQVSLLMDSVWKVVAQRRTAEEYARLSERMKHYIESSTVVLFGFEFTQEGALLRWSSDNVARYLGYSVDEIDDPDLWQANVLDEGVPNLQNIAEWQEQVSDQVVREYRFRHKDGHAIWVQEDIRILRDESGKPKEAISAWTDITERKQVERELRAQKELRDKIFDLLPIGLWFADENGALLRGNPMGVKIWGAEPLVPPQEYGVFKARRLPSGEEIAPEDWALAHSIREGITIADELLEIDAFDGEKRVIYNYTAPIKDDDDKVTGAIVMNRDITQQYRVEQALRESENKFRALFQNNHAIMLVIDPADSKIIDANPAASRYYGWSIEELCQKHVQEISALTAEEVQAEMQRALSEECSFFKVKHRLASGEVRNVDIFSGPVEFEGRKLLYSIIHDVTERVKAQAQTRRYLQRQETLIRLGRALSSTLDLDMVYRTVRRFVLEEIPVENFAIALYDAAQASIRFQYVYADGQHLDVTEIPAMAYDPHNSLFKRSQAIAAREAVVVDGHVANVGAKGEKLFKNDLVPPQSALYVPMVSEGEPIGLIDLQSYQPNAFSASDVEWLGVVANQVSMAIKNAQLYDQIRSRLTQLNGLRDIDSFITGHLPLGQILKSILDLVQFQVEVDAADILILEEGSNQLRSAAAFGFTQETIEKVVLAADQSYAGEVLRTQKPVTFVRHEADAYVLDQWLVWQQEQFRAYIGVPLMINRDVKGVLEVFRHEPVLLDAQSQHFLETLAGQAAIAIEQRELFDGLQHSNEELRQAYDATIEGWSRAMDLRDRETEGHTQRVTVLTCRIAQEHFHFDDEALLWMRRGALLHDIGKLGVPDNILLKEGALTLEEWVIMKTHPHMAYEMIKSIDYLQNAVDIPHFHHEKWDGSGYPHGLMGESIPLPARIFAVVDVWDALTSDRPYRKAWRKEEALQYIREQSGIHFDPAVVEAFFAALTQLP